MWQESGGRTLAFASSAPAREPGQRPAAVSMRYVPIGSRSGAMARRSEPVCKVQSASVLDENLALVPAWRKAGADRRAAKVCPLEEAQA
jgi:hypothetical protein